jgi:putative membrane protein
MRVICLLFLLAFAGLIVILAVQNQHDMSLRFFEGTFTLPVAVVLALTYLLGMISGGTVVGMIRRSLRRVTEDPDSRYAAAR